MVLMDDFQRVLLRKHWQSIEIQATAAFASLQEEYHPGCHAGTSLSLMQDVHLNWLQSMSCFQITEVIAFWAQDAHKQHHLQVQIVEQSAPNHLKHTHQDLE